MAEAGFQSAAEDWLARSNSLLLWFHFSLLPVDKMNDRTEP